MFVSLQGEIPDSKLLLTTRFPEDVVMSTIEISSRPKYPGSFRIANVRATFGFPAMKLTEYWVYTEGIEVPARSRIGFSGGSRFMGLAAANRTANTHAKQTRPDRFATVWHLGITEV